MSELSTQTQLALLLTGRWALNEAAVLAPTQFWEFNRWLTQSGYTPEELLEGGVEFGGCPIDPGRVRALIGRGLGLFQKLERWRQAGAWVVSYADEGYPPRFKALKHRAPILLFGYGEPPPPEAPALAVLGSRKVSDTRLEMAHTFGKRCAEHDVILVSGGAKGSDSAGMQGALDGGGKVVGLLADSLLKTASIRVCREGVEAGQLCLMSEVNPEAHFDVGNAMARNRLAYASADGAVIIECEVGKGGTWSGALEALKVGQTLYVLAGAIAEKELVEKGAIRIAEEELDDPRQLLNCRRLASSEVAPADPVAKSIYVAETTVPQRPHRRVKKTEPVQYSADF